MQVSSSYQQKYGILYFLPLDRLRVRVYLFFLLSFFFSGVDRIDPAVLECCKRALTKILTKIKNF